MENLIEMVKAKVEDFFGKDASGHSVDHLERTLNYALFLQSKEGGDRDVIAVSAYIHDIHRILGNERHTYVSPKESLPVVSEFIRDLPLSDAQKEHILFAIEHHEDYAFGKNGEKSTDIESLILQDADNLDAIGAIGLVRTLEYAFSKKRPVYEKSVPLYQNEYDESTEDASTIHHIHNKLLRLGEFMNTKTARQLAKKKTKFLKEFAEMYVSEVNGIFD